MTPRLSARVVVVFENQFGRAYEGGARWLHDALVALGTVADPPRCLVAGIDADQLPADLRQMAHIGVLPHEPVLTPDAGPILDELLPQVGADLWVSRYYLPELTCGVPRLVCWADFGHRAMAHLRSEEEQRGADAGWEMTARTAEAIMVISQATADDALALTPHVRERLHVCGYAPVFSAELLAQSPARVAARYHLPPRYLIVCNQFWQHKNHALVLSAMAQLRADGAEPPTVVFTGRPWDNLNPDAFSDLLRFTQRSGLHGYCRFCGIVRRDEMIALIRGAEALIQPSLFEGRGAILEEASLLGTQVLCSNIPVHHELDAPGAIFFDPTDADRLAALMRARYTPSTRSSQEILMTSRRLTADYGHRLAALCADVSARRSRPASTET